MGKFFGQLKQKGPGGIPLYIYAVGAAVLLYFGYRFYKNRSGGSSGSTGTSAGAGDTGVGDVSGGAGADSGTPEPSPDTSSDIPGSTSDTAPPAGDSTGVVNGPESVGDKTGKKKKTKHPSAHDHKQGTRHTKHRAIHRRKPGTTQTHHAHAPKEHKRPPSREKARTTVKASTAMRSGELVKHGGASPPPRPHPTVAKHTPAPVPVHKDEPKIAAKEPPKKRRR